MPPKGFLYVSKLATHINNITISCQWVMGSQLLVLFDYLRVHGVALFLLYSNILTPWLQFILNISC